MTEKLYEIERHIRFVSEGFENEYFLIRALNIEKENDVKTFIFKGNEKEIKKVLNEIRKLDFEKYTFHILPQPTNNKELAGKKEAYEKAVYLVFDVDGITLTKEELNAKLFELGLTPYLIILSGSGLNRHIYFKLNEPLSINEYELFSRKLAEILEEKLNCRIDKQALVINHLFRLAGSLNQKSKNYASIELDLLSTLTKNDILSVINKFAKKEEKKEEIFFKEKELKQKELSEEQINKIVELTKAYNIYQKGERNNFVFVLICSLIKLGYSKDSIENLVKTLANEFNDEEAKHRTNLVKYYLKLEKNKLISFRSVLKNEEYKTRFFPLIQKEKLEEFINEFYKIVKVAKRKLTLEKLQKLNERFVKLSIKNVEEFEEESFKLEFIIQLRKLSYFVSFYEDLIKAFNIFKTIKDHNNLTREGFLSLFKNTNSILYNFLENETKNLSNIRKEDIKEIANELKLRYKLFTNKTLEILKSKFDITNLVFILSRLLNQFKIKRFEFETKILCRIYFADKLVKSFPLVKERGEEVSFRTNTIEEITKTLESILIEMFRLNELIANETIKTFLEMLIKQLTINYFENLRIESYKVSKLENVIYSILIELAEEDYNKDIEALLNSDKLRVELDEEQFSKALERGVYYNKLDLSEKSKDIFIYKNYIFVSYEKLTERALTGMLNKKDLDNLKKIIFKKVKLDVDAKETYRTFYIIDFDRISFLLK